jgi:hypothetical protein
MRGRIVKSLASGAAAVALAGVMSLASAPANAAFYHGGGFGGFHGGFGGFHGGFGGFHGGFGGFRGGFGGFRGPAMGAWRGGWARPGWGWRGGWARPGWGWRGGWARPGWGWRRGYWNNGWWWGPAIAGGLIVGSTWPYWGGGSPYYDSGYDNGYDNGCWVYRPVFNRYRHYIGQRLVNVCY